MVGKVAGWAFLLKSHGPRLKPRLGAYRLYVRI